MEGLTRRKWIGMASIPVLAGLGTYAARETDLVYGDDRPRFEPVGPDTARTQIQQRHLPNVPLLTQDGERVFFYDDLIKDKKVAVTFVSSRVPAASKKVTENLAKVQGFFGDRIGKEIFLYSITRTPEHDTPAVLKSMAVRNDAGPGWKFLTGKPSDIEALRRGLGFVSDDPAEDADPAYSMGLLRHGVEREMRWAHCQAQGPVRVIAHSMLLDFGAGPADINPIFSDNPYNPADPSTFIWDCGRLLKGLN